MVGKAKSKQRREGSEDLPARDRIIRAAFSAFTELGYAEASTLEIATRAHVSKRELYALFGGKQDMLVACITERAQRLQAPPALPDIRDRETLAQALTAFGGQVLREVSDPIVIAVFRLAIAEAVRAPEVARALDTIGNETPRAALREIMTRAHASGLLGGQPADLADQFFGLLWGNLMVRLLLRIADRPEPSELSRRARAAAEAFLQIHPPPGGAGRGDRGVR